MNLTATRHTIWSSSSETDSEGRRRRRRRNFAMHRHVARTPTAEIRKGRFVHCATALLLRSFLRSHFTLWRSQCQIYLMRHTSVHPFGGGEGKREREREEDKERARRRNVANDRRRRSTTPSSSSSLPVLIGRVIDAVPVAVAVRAHTCVLSFAYVKVVA